MDDSLTLLLDIAGGRSIHYALDSSKSGGHKLQPEPSAGTRFVDLFFHHLQRASRKRNKAGISCHALRSIEKSYGETSEEGD